MTYSFPVAAHSYFRAQNKVTEKDKFLDNDTYVPIFRYGPDLDIDKIRDRLKTVKKFKDADKSISLQLVLASALLQTDPSSESTVELFRRLNAESYGTPSKQYAEAILKNVKVAAAQSHIQLWTEIEGIVGVVDLDTNPVHFGPSQTTFENIKSYFKRFAPTLFLSDFTDVRQAMDVLLAETGLQEKGWCLKLTDDASYARIDKHQKQIILGVLYQPRKRSSIKKIVAHELYGHALKSQEVQISESEGFAVLLEQLLEDRFKWGRSYRYLAAALGWGTSSTSMNFREVFEVIWRCMVILSGYSVAAAKSYAFDECYRVFRGGRPDIAGAVYLKDTSYFAGNLEVWKQLEMAPITYEHFIGIVEGERRILV